MSAHRNSKGEGHSVFAFKDYSGDRLPYCTDQRAVAFFLEGDCMKVVRITYRDNDIDPSVQLNLFFRFVGVFAYERFFGEPKIDVEQMYSLDKDTKEGAKDIPEVYQNFDCDIYILASERDMIEYRRMVRAGEKVFAICAKEEVPEVPEVPDVQMKSCSYARNGTQGLESMLSELINFLANRNVVNSADEAELTDLARIFCSNRFYQLKLRAKYFFANLDKEQIITLNGKYNQVINQLITHMNDKGCKWGERRYYYLQFSILNLLYELDGICMRYSMTIQYNRDELIQICELLTENFGDVLNDSINMLKAQIYDDLLLDTNKAYDLYLKSCEGIRLYNSYVFYRKGMYWQEFVANYSNALKYYLDSVYIYPEYYRAWFKIGFCYQNLGDMGKAVYAYENVRNCLIERIVGNCVRPLEIEHVFKSQFQIMCIRENAGRLDEAIVAGKRAEQVVDLIATSSFYAFMCDQDQNLIDEYRDKTRKSLKVDRIYERLYFLYSKKGNMDQSEKYHEKMNGGQNDET
mgnify:CR=1 FL=1